MFSCNFVFNLLLFFVCLFAFFVTQWLEWHFYPLADSKLLILSKLWHPTDTVIMAENYLKPPSPLKIRFGLLFTSVSIFFSKLSPVCRKSQFFLAFWFSRFLVADFQTKLRGSTLVLKHKRLPFMACRS